MPKRWLDHVAAAAVLAVTVLWTMQGVRHSPALLGLRGFGYGSLVLLCLALVMGPLARLAPKAFGRLLPGRRAVGIWSAAAAVVHLLYVLEHTKRPLLRILSRPAFGPFHEPGSFTAGPIGGPIYDQITVVSALGLGALAIMLVITLVSNDPAQRFLGQSSWKLIQQQAYTAFVLVAGHVLVMQFGGKLKGNPPLLRWAPWLLLAVLLLQVAAFLHTIWRRRRARAGTEAA